jgi:N,N-dimethylformamidase beta subunit-like, C-terminal
VERLFFYDSADGSAALGILAEGDFKTEYSFAPDTFGRTWTHVAELPGTSGRLLFYRATTGEAAVGELAPASFVQAKSYPPGAFGTWTHVLGTLVEGHPSSLFYNADTGAAAAGFDPTDVTYPPGAFSPGWTHIVSGRRSWRVLFYNAATGSGALDFDPSTKVWPAGAFATAWTQVAIGPGSEGQDSVLFYNAATRAGAIGLLDESGFTTVQSWQPGGFGGWTHVVGTGRAFLFYNAMDGSAAIGTLEDTGFTTTHVYPPDSFARGWTHIAHADLSMLGCCWPLSVRPGEEIEFRTSTTEAEYQVRYVQYTARPAEEVGAAEIEDSNELVETFVADGGSVTGASQDITFTPDTGCENWDASFSLTVPGEWTSGFYQARIEDASGSVALIPFIIQPAAAASAPLALIANASTWCAYNGWGGYSRYSVPDGGAYSFSYLRPQMGALDPTRIDAAYHYGSKHLLRGELYAWSWLRDAGHEIDVHTDVDLHAGIDELATYKAVILANHPEYLSQQAFAALKAYLDGGGSLLYLGGNGVYDAVEISDDLRNLTTYGQYGAGRVHLFRQLGQPESALLGVAFPWDPVGGDIGNHADSPRVPYRVVASSHRFFAGTKVSEGDLIGAEGWIIAEGGADLTAGGASGWECDIRDDNTPDNVELLAVGTNSERPSEMVTYNHPGGGIVFSVGSMSFTGSLLVDPTLQQLLQNVLDECLS